MAHTNQTAHYHLPQYVGTDIINPLTDTNGAYEAIDTAIYEVGQTASGMADDIAALKIQNGDSALDTTAQTLSGAINELKSGADALGLRVTENETDISTLQSQMSTATGNITTLNTTVAGLQTEMAGKASATALNNLTVKVGTGNLNTTAQNCVDAINEVLAEIPSGGSVSADDVTYDNTDSGLTATNVQDAIDEVNGKIPTSLDADDVVYDNTSSGLTATDVQSAIDELAQGGVGYTETVIATVTNENTLTQTIDYTLYDAIMVDFGPVGRDGNCYHFNVPTSVLSAIPANKSYQYREGFYISNSEFGSGLVNFRTTGITGTMFNVNGTRTNADWTVIGVKY